MATSFTLTNLAKADLKDIARYTEKRWGREQRNQYLGMLDATFHLLAGNPLAGKECAEIRAGYRKMNAGSHVVFYRQPSGQPVEIVRVLHKRMDFEVRLSKPLT